MALYAQKFDGSKRFGPRTYPHVEISSKFEVLGPRNGRGPTSSKPLKVKIIHMCQTRSPATRRSACSRPRRRSARTRAPTWCTAATCGMRAASTRAITPACATPTRGPSFSAYRWLPRDHAPCLHPVSRRLDEIRLPGFTHYTTRVLHNPAMPGPLTPRHRGAAYLI